jgi:hypothetical protein
MGSGAVERRAPEKVLVLLQRVTDMHRRNAMCKRVWYAGMYIIFIREASGVCIPYRVGALDTDVEEQVDCFHLAGLCGHVQREIPRFDSALNVGVQLLRRINLGTLLDGLAHTLIVAVGGRELERDVGGVEPPMIGTLHNLNRGPAGAPIENTHLKMKVGGES